MEDDEEVDEEVDDYDGEEDDEDDNDENDEEEDEDEDDDEEESSDAGYEEDDEGEGISDGGGAPNEDGNSTMTRRYRYKRGALFGEDTTSDEDDNDEADDADDAEEIDAFSRKSGGRDSLISNFSGVFPGPEGGADQTAIPVSPGSGRPAAGVFLSWRTPSSFRGTGTRPGRSSSLSRGNPTVTTAPPNIESTGVTAIITTTTTEDETAGHSPASGLASRRAPTAHFPSPLALAPSRQQHSNLPRSPAPTASFLAGGAGYSPRIRKFGGGSGRIAGRKEKVKEPVVRDDFLPSHLKVSCRTRILGRSGSIDLFNSPRARKARNANAARRPSAQPLPQVSAQARASAEPPATVDAPAIVLHLQARQVGTA